MRLPKKVVFISVGRRLKLICFLVTCVDQTFSKTCWLRFGIPERVWRCPADEAKERNYGVTDQSASTADLPTPFYLAFLSFQLHR